MSYDLGALCEALAANLSTIPGVQESPYLLGNPTPPAAEVHPGKILYDRAFARGVDELAFIVRVLVGFTTDVGAQKLLYTMLAPDGPASVKTAIESDCTLGGRADDLWVKDCSGLKMFIREVTTPGRPGSVSGPLIGAEWTVQVLTTG